MRTALLGILLFLFGPQAAWAHKPSDSYMWLKPAGSNIQGQWDIALRDLDFAIGLDANSNGDITWGEVRSRQEAIATYALKHLAIQADGRPCTLVPGQQLIDYHADGAYNVLRFSARCAAPMQRLTVDYHLFADIDPQHRGLLNLQLSSATQTVIFSPDTPRQDLPLKTTAPWRSFLEYVHEGIWHIWTGFDHIFFLLALLLPAVLIRQNRVWLARDTMHPALIDTLKIVTAFTLAHSITLSLAVFQVVSLPSRLTESAIALTVILAALNNLYPLVRDYRWVAAFAFGLIHGFGFANVLLDLSLPKSALLLALAAFNIGVELGQVAIVALFFPLAYALRASWFYQRLLLQGGSAALTLLALIWLSERALDLKFITF